MNSYMERIDNYLAKKGPLQDKFQTVEKNQWRSATLHCSWFTCHWVLPSCWLFGTIYVECHCICLPSNTDNSIVRGQVTTRTMADLLGCVRSFQCHRGSW